MANYYIEVDIPDEIRLLGSRVTQRWVERQYAEYYLNLEGLDRPYYCLKVCNYYEKDASMPRGLRYGRYYFTVPDHQRALKNDGVYLLYVIDAEGYAAFARVMTPEQLCRHLNDDSALIHDRISRSHRVSWRALFYEVMD